jgi:hypothetical protein
MTKAIILFLLLTTLFTVGCNKKKSEETTSVNTSTQLKCPNCGSTNVGNWQGGSDDTMKECYTCGIAFKK